jgi:hypothetical protein
MKSSRFLFVPAFLIAGALIAQDAQVTPLMSKDLADFPGKEGLMITVVYLPALRIRFIGTMRMHSFTCWKAPL